MKLTAWWHYLLMFYSYPGLILAITIATPGKPGQWKIRAFLFWAWPIYFAMRVSGRYGRFDEASRKVK